MKRDEYKMWGKLDFVKNPKKESFIIVKQYAKKNEITIGSGP